MKRIAKVIVLCMVLAVGCAFSMPQQLRVKGTKKKVKWSSSKKSIATVSKKGKVRAKKAGKTVITAKVGSKNLKCRITVKKAAKKKSRGDTTASNYVYIPRTGEKYHKTRTCSNMKNPRKVTLKEAKQQGYEPCKKCY